MKLNIDGLLEIANGKKQLAKLSYRKITNCFLLTAN